MTHLGRWLTALVDGELDGAERDHVLSHLARCGDCLSEASALRALKKRMGGLGDTTADSTMTDRLVDLASTDRHRSDWLRSEWRRAHRNGFHQHRYGSRRRGPLAPGRRDRFSWRGQATRPAWVLVTGAVAAALAGVGAAAFLLGGSSPSPGAPRITPAVDAYWTQHGFDAGQAPARPGAPGPVRSAAAAAGNHSGPGPRPSR